MALIFLGDGKVGPSALRFVGEAPTSRVGVFPPDDPFLDSAGGGIPINRETVHGSSYRDRPAWAIYRASSRCRVG